MWWHVWVFMNGYTLYWTLHGALLHMENPGDELSH